MRFKRFKKMLFTMTKYNTRIYVVSLLFKLQTAFKQQLNAEKLDLGYFF